MHRLLEGFKCKVAEGGVFGMTVDLGILDYRLIVAFQLYWGHLTRMGSEERQRCWMDPPFNPPRSALLSS